MRPLPPIDNLPLPWNATPLAKIDGLPDSASGCVDSLQYIRLFNPPELASGEVGGVQRMTGEPLRVIPPPLKTAVCANATFDEVDCTLNALAAVELMTSVVCSALLVGTG